MKKLRSSVLWIAMVVAFLSGLGFRSVLAQTKRRHSAECARVAARCLAEFPRPDSLAHPGRLLPVGYRGRKEGLSRARRRQQTPIDGCRGFATVFPLASKLYTQYRQMLRTESKLEPRYHELAAVVGARETRAKGIYREWFIHARGAREEGISEDILEVIRLQKDTRGLVEKDAALIRFGREMAQGQGISSQTFAETERLFGRIGTLGIAFQVMRYSGLALMSSAYNIQLEPGQTAPW